MFIKRSLWLLIALIILLLTFVISFTTAQDQTLSLPETLAWSPDGSKLVTGHRDGKLAIWDTSTGNLITIYQLTHPTLPEIPLAIIWRVKWSPDSNYIAISDLRDMPFGIIMIIDASTGEPITHMETQGYFADIAWSLDGEKLASAVSSVSQIALADALVTWNPLTGEELQRINPPELQGITSIAWSPDGNQIVVGGAIDDHLTIWDIRTGNKLQVLAGHTEKTRRVSWNSITNQIASSADDNRIKIWNGTNGQEIFSVLVDSYLEEIVWSPGTSLLAAATGGKIRILDATTGQFTQEITLTDFKGTEKIAWSPYGGRLAYTRIIPSTETSSTQTLSSSGTEMIVPVATVQQLNNVALACKANPGISDQSRILLDNDQIQTLTSDSIPDFIIQIESLPEEAIPAGCAADLIAVAEAIIAQE